ADVSRFPEDWRREGRDRKNRRSPEDRRPPDNHRFVPRPPIDGVLRLPAAYSNRLPVKPTQARRDVHQRDWPHASNDAMYAAPSPRVGWSPLPSPPAAGNASSAFESGG